jgi:excisionase family DNA binding protein
LGEGVSLPRETVDDLASRIEKIPHALKVLEVCEYLEVGKTTVYDWVATDNLTYFRIGGLIRFDPVHLAQWLREHRIDARRERKKAA